MNYPVIVLPGWNNDINAIKVLYESLNKIDCKKYLFDYRYKVPEKEWFSVKGVYAPFEVMQERFYNFILNENILTDYEKVNIIGYSQGGMIALYSLGLHYDININKFVSIASPHRGAFTKYFDWFEDGSVTSQMEWDSDFLKENGEYETASKNFFTKYNKNNLLQIYSETDIVATKESTLRFKDMMEVFKISQGYRNHIYIPKNKETITKVSEFLSY